MPGSIRRSKLPPKSIRRRQSMIRPSASIRIRFALRPMSSMTSFFCASIPSSSRVSRLKTSMRSPSGWATPVMRAPSRCLRSSMQNMGGSAGFSNEACVRWTRAFPVPTAQRRRSVSPLERSVNSTISRSGCWILSIFAPISFSFSSRVTPERQIASSGISIPP